MHGLSYPGLLSSSTRASPEKATPSLTCGRSPRVSTPITSSHLEPRRVLLPSLPKSGSPPSWRSATSSASRLPPRPGRLSRPRSTSSAALWRSSLRAKASSLLRSRELFTATAALTSSPHTSRCWAVPMTRCTWDAGSLVTKPTGSSCMSTASRWPRASRRRVRAAASASTSLPHLRSRGTSRTGTSTLLRSTSVRVGPRIPSRPCISSLKVSMAQKLAST
mmetsp:Transcript_17562/g.24641  ORF Transcript_17562/g.24641 Transcript_17562/m.24641 type:complete len:221 (-) Transcript_17562:337-999(-)